MPLSAGGGFSQELVFQYPKTIRRDRCACHSKSVIFTALQTQLKKMRQIGERNLSRNSYLGNPVAFIKSVQL